MPFLGSLFLPKAVLFVVTIRAVPTPTLTTIPPFEVVLFCEDLITLFGQVKITFFQGDSLVHFASVWRG